jgi:hypothetical protein
MRVEIAQGIEAFQAYDEGSIPFTRSNLRQFGSREIVRNLLKQHGRFGPQSGEKPRSINVVGQILIPPFGGSNPPAPASQCGLHYAISGCVRTADIPAG